MKYFIIAVFSLLCAPGCSEGDAGAKKLSAKEEFIIEAARKTVGQYEDWVDRAEFQIKRSNQVWVVTARRVEHPEAKGNMRYVPWGRRDILIEDSGKVVGYGTGK